MSTDRNVGVIQMRPEQIERLLGLPEGHHIVALQSDWVQGVLNVRVEGPQLPLTAANAAVPLVKMVMAKQANGTAPRVLRFEQARQTGRNRAMSGSR